MSWKKNIFSYVMWMIYSGATCVGILGVSSFACSTAGYPAEYGFGVAGIYLLLIGIFVLLGRRLVFKRGQSESHPGKKQYGKILESLGFVLLLAAGLWLRIAQLMSISEAAAGTAYLEAAYVTDGAGVPLVVHGGTYFYLWLLHMLFYLFGNRVAVALILQIVLQILGMFAWYFAVRKLAGVSAAIVSFAFMMLSPYMVGTCAEVSPAFLLFLFYSIVLYWAAASLKSGRNPVWIVLTGAAAGMVTYLDIFGITILTFLVSVLTLKREKQQGFWHGREAVILCAVLGAAAGFFLLIGIDALISGKAFGNVLWAWYKLYQPAFSLVWAESSVWGNHIWSIVDIVLLLAGMTVGCFSFWFDKKYNRQGVWIAFAVILTMLLTLQMEKFNVGSEAYLYIVFTVLAGIGVDAVFLKNDKEMEMTAALVQVTTTPVLVKEEAEQVVPAAESNPLSTIQFLENPLPVPKKHTPKILDYRLKGDDGDQFDLDVPEEDDFDI